MMGATQAGAVQPGADRPDAVRWSACLLLVAGLHAGVVLHLRGATPAMPALPPEAVLIDLAPAAVPAPAEAIASELERQDAQSASRLSEVPATVESRPAKPAPPELAPLSPAPLEAMRPESLPAPLESPAPAPEVALALPPPPALSLPPVRRAPSRPAPLRPAPEARRPAPTEMPPGLVAAPAPSTTPAPSAGASSPSQAPAWQGALLGRLQRAKRYPDLARARREEGGAHLTFTMDRNGRVLSARIARSSGSVELDAETLALVRRAEPLPAPPADVPGDPLTLTVPLRFSLR